MAPGASDNHTEVEQRPGKDDGYEHVSHEDVAMQGQSDDSDRTEDLSLQRYENSLDQGHDDEDSEDEEGGPMSHPLFGMLASRLGQRRRGSIHKYDKLHPENQVLTISDLEDCVELEHEAFPPEEQASREKFEYRLTKCPELCLGIFSQPTKAEAEKGNAGRRRLIGHLIATRSSAPAVTDASMEIPSDWKTTSKTPGSAGPKVGHDTMGGTICIHSIAVRKDCQSLGVGSMLLKSYVQRMKDAKIADRLALLAHDHMTKFYGRLGFEDMGPSSCEFGGGGWNNMILEFSDLSDD